MLTHIQETRPAAAPTAKPSDYYAHARVEILPFIPPHCRSIVDLGGSSGATLSAIKAQRPDAATTCVDMHQPALEVARARGHAVLNWSLEGGVPPLVADCDVALFLDVLEHLCDPWTVLRSAADMLPVGATVIVSLPNVRYWDVSLPLLMAGRWELQDAGVLDRTHLRFFTRRSGEALVRQAGLTVNSVVAKLPGARRYRVYDAASLGLLRDFLCPQFIYVASKDGHA